MQWSYSWLGVLSRATDLYELYVDPPGSDRKDYVHGEAYVGSNSGRQIQWIIRLNRTGERVRYGSCRRWKASDFRPGQRCAN